MKKQAMIAVFVGILSSLSVMVMAQGGEIPTATGQGVTGTTATTAVSPVAEATQTVEVPPGPQPNETTPPSDSGQSDSVIPLLKESDAAMKSAADNHKGVHVAESSFFSREGESSSFISDGDFILPDRAKVTAEIHLPKRLQPEGWHNGPLVVDVVAIADMLYLKPDFCDCWSSYKMKEKSNPAISDAEMEAIDFYDFISASKNLGQETLASGDVATHVHVEIDVAAVIEKIKSEMGPAEASKYGSQLDQLKTSTITSEVWIGTDDKLVYQVISKFNNSDLQMSADDTFNLTNWGQIVEITAPV